MSDAGHIRSGNPKRALVTGAGSGIGKATALLLAERGNSVAVLGRTESELQKTADEIAGLGAEAILLLADISNASQMQSAFEHITAQWDSLDVVVANAGINGVWAPLEYLEPEEWDQTININLRGTFLTVKYAIPLLKDAGGSVVVTSSELGTRVFSRTGSTAYACTKAAQVALVKQQALELAQYKIRVNVVCPGWIKTEVEDNMKVRRLEVLTTWAEYPKGVIPLTGGVLPDATRVAKLIAFLVSDEADHITGTEVYIDGAESLLL
ncbi:MAG: SDR family oxidoreductase [Planctomycetes bacterium]|nr:SDR family oxidoreductase [Planctomycetota bacterium]